MGLKFAQSVFTALGITEQLWGAFFIWFQFVFISFCSLVPVCWFPFVSSHSLVFIPHQKAIQPSPESTRQVPLGSLRFSSRRELQPESSSLVFSDSIHPKSFITRLLNYSARFTESFVFNWSALRNDLQDHLFGSSVKCSEELFRAASPKSCSEDLHGRRSKWATC